MAWIEFHQSLLRHRKTLVLAAELHTPRMQVVGHLAALWCWALDNAPSGDLSLIPPQAIAVGAEWERKPEAFVMALVSAGFLDHDGDAHVTLHDWDDYAGRLMYQRERNRKNTKAARNRLRAGDVSGTVSGRSASTVPYPTVPNHTQPPPPPPTPSPVAAVAVAVVDEDVFLTCIRAHDDMKGTMASGPTVQKIIREWIESSEGAAHNLAEWFESACEKATMADVRTLSYVMGILKREAKEGREDRRVSKNGVSVAAEGPQMIVGGMAVKTFEQEAKERRAAEAARGA